MPDIVLPRVEVLGHRMAYRTMGQRPKPVVLFLHGNPTSSYIWRNIMPIVSEVAYCVAPDLIGFGQSDKPDIAYRFADHVAFLDGFVCALGIEQAWVVAQDWGTALAFDLAWRRPSFIKGLGFMEFIRPMPTWDDFHQAPQARELFKKFRTPGVGESLVLQQNAFVEKVLPGSILRRLDEDEMDVYRAPFPDERSRIPMLRFPNELPIAGEPACVWKTLSDAHSALRVSNYPKRLFVGNPGALVSPDFARQFSATLKNCDVVEVGAGMHYLQEDHPSRIAEGVIGLIGRGTEAAPSQPGASPGRPMPCHI